ncbi:MAG: hypothetical protein ACYDBX_01470 [Patescibacteria group bacterium]
METELQIPRKSKLDTLRSKFHEKSNIYSSTGNEALGHQIGVLMVSIQTELFKSGASIEDTFTELAVLARNSQFRATGIKDKLSETLFRVLYEGYTAVSNGEVGLGNQSKLETLRKKFDDISTSYSKTGDKALGFQIGVSLLSIQTELFKSDPSLGRDIWKELAGLSKNSQDRAMGIEDTLAQPLFGVLYDGYQAMLDRQTSD